MGIKFYCPNGHKLNVKSFLAGKRGICPKCGTKVDIPAEEAAMPGEIAQSAPPLNGAVASSGPVPVTRAIPAEPTIPMPETPSMPTSPIPSVAVVPSGGPPIAPARGTTDFSSNSAPVASPAVPTPVATAVAPAGPMDPVDEAPNATWYVRPPSGGQFGPANGEVMRKWITEGRVSAESMVWREGWADWKQAGPLFPSLGGSAAITPAPVPAPAAAMATVPVSPGVVQTPTHPATGGRHPRRKPKNNNLLIAMVVVLVMAIFGLLPLLVFVVMR